MSQRLTNILGYLTLFALLAAVWVLFGEDPALDQGARGERTFAGLDSHINDTATITVVKGDARVTLKRGEGGWTVMEREGYWADMGKLQAFLRGAALSERREPKTDNQDHFSRLGLGADALDVGFADANGTALAGFRMGIRKDGAAGRSLTYIYQPGDTRAWLVTGLAAAEADPVWWLDTKVVDIDEVRLHEVRLDGAVLTRPLGTENFSLADLKAGEDLQPAWQLREVSRALAFLSVSDVRALANPIMEPRGKVTAATHDGLVLDLTLFDLDGAVWAQVAATFDAALRDAGEAGAIPNVPADGAAEAAAINARTSGWLYKLSERTGELFARKRVDFLKPATEAESAS